MRAARPSGYTLSEVLITVAIIAIIASMAIPSFLRAVERGQWRGAQDVLLTIYAGEQVYEAVNGGYIEPAGCAPPWRCVYVDNPNGGVVTYTVDGVSKVAFRATAARGDGRCMSINQTKAIAFNSGLAGCVVGWPQP